jgi:hypothetical protein
VRASNDGRQGKASSYDWVIGDANFQKEVCERDAKNRLTPAQCVREGISLNQVLAVTARKTNVDAKSILRRSCGTLGSEAGMFSCFLARELCLPSRETGTFLRIQQAAVSHTARKGALLAEARKIRWG